MACCKMHSVFNEISWQWFYGLDWCTKEWFPKPKSKNICGSKALFLVYFLIHLQKKKKKNCNFTSLWKGWVFLRSVFKPSSFGILLGKKCSMCLLWIGSTFAPPAPICVQTVTYKNILNYLNLKFCTNKPLPTFSSSVWEKVRCSMGDSSFLLI